MAEECSACKSAIGLSMRLALLLTLSAVSALAQEPLRQKIRAIAREAHGKVSVACSLPGSALNCDLSPNALLPMQSVFKLPLALTVLHQVEEGALLLGWRSLLMHEVQVTRQDVNHPRHSRMGRDWLSILFVMDDLIQSCVRIREHIDARLEASSLRVWER